MSHTAPNLVSGTSKPSVKVIFSNERVIVGHKEYIVEHVFVYGLKSADIVFNKSSVEGSFIYSDQPYTSYVDNTLILGLNENKLICGDAFEEVIYSSNDEIKIFSKPLYVRLVSDGDKVTVYLNGRRSYEANKVYLHVEHSNHSIVINILVNPIKILWLSIEEALIRLILSKDTIRIQITKT
ncbi:MAG: hypothetical protein QXT88_00185 [Desulfurococcaceae archaeon]|uniref:Uncharacterized protein n=1 Tax=Staphylothermus marinus TaxID=2280 RepID=A0A7C4JKU0_STAMA